MELAAHFGVICSVTMEGLLWVNSQVASLPLPIKFSDHFFWRQVEINFSGCQPVMSHDLLQSSGGNAFLDAGHGEGVPERLCGKMPSQLACSVVF